MKGGNAEDPFSRRSLRATGEARGAQGPCAWCWDQALRSCWDSLAGEHAASAKRMQTRRRQGGSLADVDWSLLKSF